MVRLTRCRNGTAPDEDDQPAPRPSRFAGTGQTLGGDDTPSQTVPDPNADRPKPVTRVARTLHFWQDGFSVEDGRLYPFDDPNSAPILALIESGRAPVDIMGVTADQPVDVTVRQHEENYVPPKKKHTPFSGGGQRLGSPTPGAITSQAASTQPSSGNTQSETARPQTVDIDESQPTVSLQIRLGDGTRLVSRFNTAHTIGDVYNFVRATNPASAERPWVLMTTFPSKELSDKDVALSELSEFKRGGVVVQRWQ